MESGVECGKEQRLGDGVFRIFCIKRVVLVLAMFVFDPVWEIQLDTLSCMSTSIQSG